MVDIVTRAEAERRVIEAAREIQRVDQHRQVGHDEILALCDAVAALDALPADDGWRPTDEAPINETVIGWGGAGGMRFMRKDEHGQWRGMMGNPKDAPRFWRALPAPPDDGGKG